MAGNARFHDKLHRKNHHTNPTVGYSDSASDPIASPSEPFQGDFVINGKLSSNSSIEVLSANILGDIYCNNIKVSAVTYTNWISGNSTETIISDGSLTGYGNNTLTLDYQKGIYGKSPFFSISNTLCSLGTITSPSATFNTLTVKISSNLNGPLSVIGNTTLSGNLGIGISALSSRLHVYENSNNPAVKITQLGSTGAALYVEDQSGDNSPTVIDYKGHMGIGTTTPNKELTVVGDVSATGTIYTANSSYLLSSNGYTKLQNGLMMQWGRFTCSNSNETKIIFPIVFTNSIYNIVTNPVNQLGSVSNYSTVGNFDLSSFNTSVYDISGNRTNQSIFWQAMGY